MRSRDRGATTAAITQTANLALRAHDGDGPCRLAAVAGHIAGMQPSQQGGHRRSVGPVACNRVFHVPSAARFEWFGHVSLPFFYCVPAVHRRTSSFLNAIGESNRSASMTVSTSARLASLMSRAQGQIHAGLTVAIPHQRARAAPNARR